MTPTLLPKPVCVRRVTLPATAAHPKIEIVLSQVDFGEPQGQTQFEVRVVGPIGQVGPAYHFADAWAAGVRLDTIAAKLKRERGQEDVP